MTLTMAKRSEFATPENSDEESGGAFTDGDFDDIDDETIVEAKDYVNETVNTNITDPTSSFRIVEGQVDGLAMKINVNGADYEDLNNQSASEESGDFSRDSQSEGNTSIVGILGGQQNHVCNELLISPFSLLQMKLLFNDVNKCLLR